MPRLAPLLLLLAATPLLAAPPLSGPPVAGQGNRLAYLDEVNPYYPHADFPKLITPQWVGEEGVEAVVILAIDDMRDTAKYEAYLRPILLRLRQIDGRAPVSIMSCNVDPKDPQLQAWLDEGLSIEIHTVDHPCPLLAGGDFAKAKSTYDRCVHLMASIPRNDPVAFRMPCCDSLNTVSPRFYADIFNATTENGRFLQASSSVFNLFTPDDPEIPRELVLDAEGRERFRRYLPRNLVRNGKTFDTFVNWIENYPYPYVIGGRCWEFPCAVPSDWEAQHLQGVNNPRTVEDMQRVLDITVAKQGVMNLVFHPHGWIRSDQVVELIDHAVEKHGKKVKFLTFREAVGRLNENLLKGHPLRNEQGRDGQVRVLDVDADGYMDVVSASKDAAITRVWQPEQRSWSETPTPFALALEMEFPGRDGVPTQKSVVKKPSEFGVLHPHGRATYAVFALASLVAQKWTAEAWTFGESSWQPEPNVPKLGEDDVPDGWGFTMLRDIDGDGLGEWLVPVQLGGGRSELLVVTRDAKGRSRTVRWPAPEGGPLPVLSGLEETGGAVRLVDVDEDGALDVVHSGVKEFGVWLWTDWNTGWSTRILHGNRNEVVEGDIVLPPIGPALVDGKVRDDNGFFVHSRHLFWQNEDTDQLPDLVDRVSFDDLLKNHLPGPKSPEQSLRLMEPRPGFKVELVAAEPLVMDPVAFEWGADGRLWVAEMADYPLGIEGGGRVRFLEDTTGDGKYDKSTLFLDGLKYPSGVTPWRDGVLISAAPDVLFARDTDGDGRADKVETLLTGFGEGNQQHRVNGFAYGLDNWVHCANGDSNGQIKSLRTGKVTDINGRDFRFDPDTGELDPTSGRTQFGRNRDDWGNWFGGNNSNPMWHYALDDRYLRRNPHAVGPDPKVHISVTPGAAPCYPISRPLPRFNDFDKLNRFTSANSPMIYRDRLFGPAFEGSSFVSEPVHNLVHREIVEPRGVTFTSRRADDEQTSEFLASRDNWFRPTMLKTGPDGFLYVADMYRFVIEHPQYIPKETWDDWDFRAGDNRGRIYRVVPVGAEPPPVPRLDGMTPAELVFALESSNGWQRDTIQRLLVERGERDIVPELTTIFRCSANRLSRLHALCTLDGLDALNQQSVLAALLYPDIRRHGIRLAEPWLAKSEKVAEAVLALVDADDPPVRLQLAYSLGEWDDPRAATALAKLAVAADDPYTLAAVQSSLTARNVGPVIVAVAVAAARDRDGDPERLANLLVLATRMGDAATVPTVFDALLPAETTPPEAWQLTATGEVLDALHRRNLDVAKIAPHAARRLPTLFDDARRIVHDGRADTAARSAAVSLLGREPEQVESDRTSLSALLAPREPHALLSAAIERLVTIGAAAVVLERWRSLTPPLRNDALDALASRPASLGELLDAIERGTVRAAEIDPAHRQRLLQVVPAGDRERATRALADGVNEDRRQVLDDYHAAIETPGDADRGRLLFAKSCATCHRIGETGHAVGPDLAALKDKSPASLLVALLDPNRAVESKYLNYVAVTTDGRSFAGILESETGSGLVLLAPEGKRVTLPRSDLELLESTAASAMPVGLEKDLKPADVADLIAFLRGLGDAPPR